MKAHIPNTYKPLWNGNLKTQVHHKEQKKSKNVSLKLRLLVTCTRSVLEMNPHS